MKHSLNDVGSFLGTRFTEQGAVCLQANHWHTWLKLVYLDTWEARWLLTFFHQVEWNATHLGQLLSMHTAHTASLWKLLSEVHLVSNNTHGDFLLRWILNKNKGHCKIYSCFWAGSFLSVSISSYLNLIHPCSDVEEAAFWSDIVEEQDSVSFTEIRPGNTSKPAVKKQ